MGPVGQGRHADRSYVANCLRVFKRDYNEVRSGRPSRRVNHWLIGHRRVPGKRTGLVCGSPVRTWLHCTAKAVPMYDAGPPIPLKLLLRLSAGELTVPATSAPFPEILDIQAVKHSVSLKGLCHADNGKYEKGNAGQ